MSGKVRTANRNKMHALHVKAPSFIQSNKWSPEHRNGTACKHCQMWLKKPIMNKQINI